MTEVLESCLDAFLDLDNFLDPLDVLESSLCSFISEEELSTQCEKNVPLISTNSIIYTQLYG